MKKIVTLSVFLMALTFGAMAQVAVISIDSCRVTTNGTTPVDSGMKVQVSGTVYGPNSYPTANGQVFWLNNGTSNSGIKIYSHHVYGGYPTLTDGDQVTVVGNLTDYYGAAEIDVNDTAALDTIYKTGTVTPDTAVVILPAGLSTLNYGFLVQVNNVNMTTATKWGRALTNPKPHFTAKASTPSGFLYIYVDSFTNAAMYNAPQPSGIYNVVGISDEYSPTSFNIDPRSLADFILVQANGIDELTALTAAIYPNPAQTQLNVSVGSEKNETITAQMFDVTGRMVLNETKELVNGENNLQFNTANFTNGMYILELRTSEKYMNTKIVVSK